MSKAVKGGLAATAGVFLLLGGAGTLASWTTSEDATGSTNIASGNLVLGAMDCTGTGLHDWRLDGALADITALTKVVPGDILTKVCEIPLTLSGDHIGATLAISSPSFADNSATSLDELLAANTTALFKVDGAAYAPVTGAGTHTINVTLQVEFPATATNLDTRDVTTTLNAITVTASQTHAP